MNVSARTESDAWRRFHEHPVNLSPCLLSEGLQRHQQRPLVTADHTMTRASSAGAIASVEPRIPYGDEAEAGVPRARGIVLYLEDGGQLGPCITERLALAQRDVGLLVAPVIAALPGGEDQVGATPDTLAHRDRLAEALIETAAHVLATVAGRGLPLVVIAEGVAAAAALRAAARCPSSFAAIVLVDGRVELAGPVLDAVTVPLLLLVDSRQPTLVAQNRLALASLHPATQLAVLASCENSGGERDCCASVLNTMRGWLSTVPALSYRPTSSRTSREVIRVAAARIRRAVTTVTRDPDPGDPSRHLWPAL